MEEIIGCWRQTLLLSNVLSVKSSNINTAVSPPSLDNVQQIKYPVTCLCLPLSLCLFYFFLVTAFPFALKAGIPGYLGAQVAGYVTQLYYISFIYYCNIYLSTTFRSINA